MIRNGCSKSVKAVFPSLLVCLALAGCQEDSDSKSTFRQQLLEWNLPAHCAHPRILARKMGIPDTHSKLSQAREQFLTTSQQLLHQGVPDFSEFKPSRNPARNMAERLAFTYQLTGDQRYSDMAKIVLRYMLNWQEWVVPEHKPLTVDLGVAGVACSMAMAYDWLYPTLTESERNEIEDALRQRALDPFCRIYKEKSESWTEANHNWRSVICGEMGITAMAMHDKLANTKEILGQAADGVIDVLNHGGRDGDWDEGVHYWGFGIGQAMLFIHALYLFSHGQLDLYQIPFLRHTGDFGLHLRTPEGDCFGYSDHENGPPRPWLMAALAARFHNPYWQWQALQDLQPQLESLLFVDEMQTASAPDTQALGKYFRDTEVATLRSGWDADAVFLGIKSGRTDVNHAHLDLNSFVVHAFGKPLLVEMDTWPYAHRSGFFDVADRRWDFECNATCGHNTLLVDGLGQNGSLSAQGRIVAFKCTPAISFVVAKADKAYSEMLHRYHRFFVLVNGVIILADDVDANGMRNLEWLYHYESSIIEKQNGTFEIVNGQARALLVFIRPDATEDRIIKFMDSQSHYTASDGTCVMSNRYLSVRPLHRQKAYRSLTAIIPFPEGKQPDYEFKIIEETQDDIYLSLRKKIKSEIIHFDLKRSKVALQQK